MSLAYTPVSLDNGRGVNGPIGLGVAVHHTETASAPPASPGVIALPSIEGNTGSVDTNEKPLSPIGIAIQGSPDAIHVRAERRRREREQAWDRQCRIAAETLMFNDRTGSEYELPSLQRDIQEVRADGHGFAEFRWGDIKSREV